MNKVRSQRSIHEAIEVFAEREAVSDRTVIGPLLYVLMASLTLYISTPIMTQAEEGPIQLRLSHWVPPSHPLEAAIQDWANDISSSSNHSIVSVIFPAELLGKAFDHYNMARDGISSASLVSPGYEPGRFPIIAAADLPFLYADAKAGTRAVDTWYRKYASRELRDVHYCFAFVQDPGTLHSRKKVVTPDDIKGLRIRQPTATIGEFLKLLGAVGLKASAPDSRDLLARGEADGIFFPWQSTVLFGIDKVVKYDIDVQMYGSVFLWVMYKHEYDGMSTDQRRVIDSHCTTEWAVRFASSWADFEAAGREIVKAERGSDFIELSPDQLEQWRKAAEPLQALWRAGVSKVGGNSDGIWKELQSSLLAYHASRLRSLVGMAENTNYSGTDAVILGRARNEAH